MKKNAPHKIQPNSLKLNFALNTTRTVLNFLIPLAIFPYISRVLEPDGFGKVEFANSIVSYFVLFGNRLYAFNKPRKPANTSTSRPRRWNAKFHRSHFVVNPGALQYISN